MRHTTAEKLAQAQDNILNEMFEGQKDVQRKLRDLTACDGWPYLGFISHSILKEYECQPPAKGEECTKWDTYTRMKWALDKLLGTVRTLAAQEIPEPPQRVGRVQNANNRPRSINTTPPARRPRR